MHSNWHEITLKVRYQETDRMGVVYYANHFVWFEIARTEFFRSRGISYRELEEKNNVNFMVVEARCRYKSPVTYDDIVTIKTRISGMHNTSLSFEYNASCAKRLVAEGDTTHVFTNKSGRPVKIPYAVKEALISSEIQQAQSRHLH